MSINVLVWIRLLSSDLVAGRSVTVFSVGQNHSYILSVVVVEVLVVPEVVVIVVETTVVVVVAVKDIRICVSFSV